MTSPRQWRRPAWPLATEQIVDLVANGVQHIHVYTMNKPWIARAIRDNLSEVFGHAAL